LIVHIYGHRDREYSFLYQYVMTSRGCFRCCSSVRNNNLYNLSYEAYRLMWCIFAKDIQSRL